MSKIVKKYWFTTFSGQVIGIIKTYDDITNEYKYRIGTGYGVDEDLDAEHIKAYGDKFNPEIFTEEDSCQK